MGLRPQLEYFLQHEKQAAKHHGRARGMLRAVLLSADDPSYDESVFHEMDELAAAWSNAAHGWQIETDGDGTRRLADDAYPRDVGPLLGKVDGAWYAHFSTPYTVEVPEEIAEAVIRQLDRAESEERSAGEVWSDVVEESREQLIEMGYEFED